MAYLFILIPFLALFILNLLPSGKRIGIAFWSCLLLLIVQVLAGAGNVLLISAGITGITALVTGWYTMRKEVEKFAFIALLLITLMGMNGIAMVEDLFTLYVFIEVTTLATFIMILLLRQREAYEGVLKYLILSVIATTLMLTSISLFILTAGGTGFAEIKTMLPVSPLALIAAALFLGGLFIKGGLVPFHGWVPDAYSAAPAAVSVFLAGIVTKAAGIFALIRVLPIIGMSLTVQSILLVFGTLSIVVGALAALGQKDMKRMLAYSSISQMGYIVAALGTGTKIGLFAALFHFFNHAVFKSQLFANAAAVEEQLGHRDMDKMGGLAQKMPVTGTTSVLASLSTAGMPPLAGFWSKLLIIIALWMAGYYVYAVIAVLSSVLTLAYFLSLQRRVFFGKVPPELERVSEVNAGMLAPVVLLSVITVGVGLLFPFVMHLFLR